MFGTQNKFSMMKKRYIGDGLKLFVIGHRRTKGPNAHHHPIGPTADPISFSYRTSAQIRRPPHFVFAHNHHQSIQSSLSRRTEQGFSSILLALRLEKKKTHRFDSVVHKDSRASSPTANPKVHANKYCLIRTVNNSMRLYVKFSTSLEMDKPAKEAKELAKETPTSQEQSSGNPMGAVPDWTGFQAYSPMPPHGYLASSPQAPPYMWGVQHLMPPYGAPHPYLAMYPHGGMYTHPSMPPGSYPYPYAMPSPNGVAEASGNTTPGSMEVNGKSSEGKEKLPIKRSKGSLGSLNMITGKNNESSKTGASGNGSSPKSGESGSEGSSEGSDANSENNSQMKSGSRQDSMEGEESQNGNNMHGCQNGGPNHSMAIVPISGPGSVVGPGPTTNLNIGGMLAAAGSRETIQPQIWLQDERELKRQRRKQSNRESARRSRLRKQAECDELAQRAEALKDENASLRAEVSRIRTDYDQLLAENASLKERLGETPKKNNEEGETQVVQSG
ncbi:unnamed protein product [Lactuca saligna]|uniref:BZIP domain-containing protein n=1 Tax=Lactuca saligna TaxID=75948 RepID=A0AA35YJ13_LACSI|nr:unnamed protein product [Lactuca saligna]